MKARCAASPDFTAALPGGAWFDRGPDDPGGAYAVFTLALDGDPEWDSASYLQTVTLRMVAYTVQGLTGAATSQAAQLALAAAINTGATAWDALRAGKVLHGLPKGYDGKHAPELRGGRDVFAAAGQWSLLVNGSA